MKTPVRHRVGPLLTSLCLPLFAQAAEVQPIHKFSLDNSLKVTMRENHRTPVVISQLWYRIGSSYETPELTGLSHTLEHMMFKSSRKLGPGEASRVLRGLGAGEDAFTTDDHTAYYQVLARDHLPVVLGMEADCIVHLNLPTDQFGSEIEVIREECRLRTDDNPNALAFERFKTVAHPASGYHTPTINWMADLRRMAIDDLRHRYKSWYAPNNATLVVVGDVTADGVKTLAKRYFDEIPWRQLSPAHKPLELAKPGECRPELCVHTQLPSLIMGFNVPSLGNSENPREINVLRLIGALLDGGYSTRLASHLECGEELVVGVSAYYDAFDRGDNLFVLSATPGMQKDKAPKQVEAGLRKQFDDLKQNPPSATEIEYVHVQIVTGIVYEKDSIAVQASSISRSRGISLSWKLIDQDLEALKAVTPDDIQKAARIYFVSSRLTLMQVLSMKAEEEETRHE